MKKTTIKKANPFVFWLLRAIFRFLVYVQCGHKFDYKTSKGIKSPCLILSNHQTLLDPFAIGIGFPFGINFVAGDSLFRHGFIGRIMQALVRTIPYRKGCKDMSAITEMFSIIKQGGTVGLFVSGNSSFFGEESSVKPGIGKLAKKLGVPVVITQIRGGYNVKPRWKTKPNKGIMRAGVARVISADELKTLSYSELDEIILNGLYHNEFEWNRREQIVYRGKHKAEHLEIVLFYCPQCGNINTLSSGGNEFFCTSCGMRVGINGIGFFDKINNADKCPDTILEWSKLQLGHIKSIDYTQYMDTPLFFDENVRFSHVIHTTKQEPLDKGIIALYGDRISVCNRDFPVEKISDMTIQSMCTFIMYTNEGTFVADFPPRSCLVKYMICGYHLRNIALNMDSGYGY